MITATARPDGIAAEEYSNEVCREARQDWQVAACQENSWTAGRLAWRRIALADRIGPRRAWLLADYDTELALLRAQERARFAPADDNEDY